MKQRDMFCLVDKDKILGVIDLEGNKIGGLFVRYNYLGNGLGKKLLTFMEDYAKKKNIKKVILYSTEYAYKFYLKQGYKFVESGKWGTSQQVYRLKRLYSPSGTLPAAAPRGSR